jgi:hypothetical protein
MTQNQQPMTCSPTITLFIELRPSKARCELLSELAKRRNVIRMVFAMDIYTASVCPGVSFVRLRDVTLQHGRHFHTQCN